MDPDPRGPGRIVGGLSVIGAAITAAVVLHERVAAWWGRAALWTGVVCAVFLGLLIIVRRGQRERLAGAILAVIAIAGLVIAIVGHGHS
jgi:hypothetical protein